MERKFCGKCGKPIAECTCAGKAPVVETAGFGTTHFENRNGALDTGVKDKSNFVKRFDNIALAEGEVVVRQYHIGAMPKRTFFQGKGGASIVITNRRVISKSDSNVLGLVNTTSVEEIGIENVVGVKNYYSQSISLWKAFCAVAFSISAIAAFFTTFSRNSDKPFFSFLLAIVWGILAFVFTRKCRKPSYLFSVYASSTGQAMVQGSNMMGKLIDRYSTGIVFRYKPTTEAIKMMCEMGACIMDLKNKGDYAIEAWKQV